MKKLFGIGALAIVGLFLIMQIVPIGRNHTNPPVVQEPAWDSPETRALVKESCFDCHSNETVWPWYSNVAPVSWLLSNHVTEGREKLNFSEWTGEITEPDEREELMEEIEEVIGKGMMPMPQYLMLHPEARLTDAEKLQLLEGFRNTLGQ